MFVFEFSGLKFKIDIKMWLSEDTPLASVVEERDTELGDRNSWIQICRVSFVGSWACYFLSASFLHLEAGGDGSLKDHSNSL